MSNFARQPLDFTVVREDWNRYDLTDNAILKIKLILTRVMRNQNAYQADFDPVYVVLSEERGQPDAKIYPPQELQAHIIRKDVRFTTVKQDWNEYVVDDGARIKIQPVVMRIAKTSLFDRFGIPTYVVDLQGTIQVTPPSSGLPQ